MILANPCRIFYRRFSGHTVAFKLSRHIVAFQSVPARFKLRLRISSYTVAFNFLIRIIALRLISSSASQTIVPQATPSQRRFHTFLLTSSLSKLHLHFTKCIVDSKQPCLGFSSYIVPFQVHHRFSSYIVTFQLLYRMSRMFRRFQHTSSLLNL